MFAVRLQSVLLSVCAAQCQDVASILSWFVLVCLSPTVLPCTCCLSIQTSHIPPPAPQHLENISPSHVNATTIIHHLSTNVSSLSVKSMSKYNVKFDLNIFQIYPIWYICSQLQYSLCSHLTESELDELITCWRPCDQSQFLHDGYSINLLMTHSIVLGENNTWCETHWVQKTFKLESGSENTISNVHIPMLTYSYIL